MARPVQRIWRLRSPFEPSCLMSAMRRLVIEHPALRTRLIRSYGGWRQQFPKYDALVEGVAITGRTFAHRVGYAHHLLDREAALPFDLCHDPPLRTKIITFDDNYYLSLTLDHIACDEIAFDLLQRSLSDTYQQEIKGQTHYKSPAADLFFGYLAREIDRRSTEQDNLSWNREHLHGVPLSLHGELEIEWVTADSVGWQIEGELLAELRRSCRIMGVTPLSAILAAQARLRAEIDGQNDVVLNVPVSNRTQSTDHYIIANLSMLLHVRIPVIGNVPRRIYLHTVRNELLGSMLHRQHDYAALSREVAADARSRGGTIDWRWGCSMVVERAAAKDAGELFAERLDGPASGAFKVPSGSCVFAVRDDGERVKFTVDWPSSDNGIERSRRFLQILAGLLDVPSLVSLPIGTS